jgi:hypothetical protein
MAIFCRGLDHLPATANRQKNADAKDNSDTPGYYYSYSSGQGTRQKICRGNQAVS